jgi:hypothetical protein
MISNRSSRSLIIFFCVIMLGTAASTATSAAVTGAQQSAIRAHCRNDFMAECSSVSPGGKAALECLQWHVGTLSPACQAAIKQTLPQTHHAAKEHAIKAPAAPPPSGSVGNEPAFVPGAALILKACARTVLLHCHHMGEGRAVACIRTWRDSGHFVGFRCKAALRVQSKL